MLYYDHIDLNKYPLINLFSGLHHRDHHQNNRIGKVLCEACLKKCSGNVLRVGKVYFHIACFKCHG